VIIVIASSDATLRVTLYFTTTQTPLCCAKYQHKATLTLRAIQENSDRLMGHLLVIEAGQVRICPIL
jgi:hypothetical protein